MELSKKLDFGGLFDGIVPRPSILAKYFVVKEKYPGGPSPAGIICMYVNRNRSKSRDIQ
jgi:hypothetical protein